MFGYLFVHFTSEQADGEQVYFSASKDGMFWKDLNSGKPVLRSTIGECGARDPFIVKHPKTGTFYLMATDLRIESGKGWEIAQHHGSKDLIIWESQDLVHWGEPRSVRVGIDSAGCAWAPESIYDNEKQAFFVYWASMVKQNADNEPKQCIYGAYTQNFASFTKPFVYLEAECHVIDLNIVYEDGWYYRFVKDETIKKIRMDKMKALHDNNPEIVSAGILDEMFGLEGPEAYQLPNGRWCLLVDQYRKKAGYLPLICDKLSIANFRVADEHEYCMGRTKKRHGGIIRVTGAELLNLTKVL